MSKTDTDWLDAAYQVLAATTQAMHVREIEEEIRTQQLVSQSPSMPLEVLLTKEAAMGRQFTKPENSTPGYFSLLSPSVSSAPAPLTPLETEFSLPPISNKIAAAAPADERPPSPSHGYRLKYAQLKSTCKHMIYLNAALNDEIVRMERKIEQATSERRALLLKLMADQNIPVPTAPIINENNSKQDFSSVPPNEAVKRKAEPTGSASTIAKKLKSGAADMLSKLKKLEPGYAVKSSSKKSKTVSKSILIPSISLDSNGRPVLPLQLPGGLTLFSLGEVNDRPGYCRSECIYPVGYCCTRHYADLEDIHKKSLYTCKITETADGPKFEISPDKDPDKAFVSTVSPEDCHSKLVDFFKQSLARDLEITTDSDFFGLKSPIIKNLLQCSPGAQHCLEYSWCKFQVVRSCSKTSATPSLKDAATTFRALQHWSLGSAGASESQSDDSGND